MAKKAIVPKKTPVSKKAGLRRIKECTCIKDDNGLPHTKNFTAEPFQGVCCKECLEIVSFEPLTKENDDINSNKGGNEGVSFASSNNEEVRRNGLGII